MRTLTNFKTTMLHYINLKTIFSVVVLVCCTQIGFGQTTIFNESGGGSEPSGWTFENNVTSQPVDKGSYWLVEDGTTNDFIITAFYDLSAYLSAEFSLDVATFGSGTNNPAKIEFSTDNGNTYTQTEISNTPTSSSYINGGAFTLNNLSSQVVIRISSNGTSGKDVRLRNLELSVIEDQPGISLGALSGNTSEDGTTATFTAVLNTAPASVVVLDVTSGDTGEVTVAPSSVTFTAANWDTPQTITATGVDDSDLDGDIDVTITVAVNDASSDAAYAGISETTTVTNDDDEVAPIPTLIITELADPNNNAGGRYVEIYNVGDAAINLSDEGITLRRYINEQTSFTDLSLTGTIEANSFFVVGKSGFAGVYGFAPNQTTSSSVADSNGDDQLALVQNDTIFDIFGVVGEDGSLTCHDFEDGRAERVASSKIASDTWNTADWNVWTDTNISGCSNSTNDPQDAPDGFDPGAWIGAPRWDGATNTDWNTGGNWDTGIVPSSDADIFINSGLTNYPTAIGPVTINSGGSLTINEEASLIVSGDFTNDGSVTLNSTEDDFSSLIVTGTATGDITYNRYVNSYDTNPDGGGWDLVGTPTVMTIADFTTANAGTLKVLGDDYAFSQYDNALGQWVRYPTASPLGSFTTGQGYSMATNAGDGATVAFTGAMQTTTQNINIIDNNDANQGAGRRWNLVSNPFPSYINGNTAAGATNFIGANTAVINDQYLAVYGWDGTQYVPKNLTDAQGFSIAPGQGFWVAAASTSAASLSFTPDMRTTTGSGDFVTGPQILDYHVALKLYNGETQKAMTNFYFKDGLSLDLDSGYDAGAFNQSTKLSSRLAMGSNQTAFSINAMGMDAMQNTRVPLEIRQNAGQAFRVSMTDVDLPEDIYVYLEDTLNGTLTSLKEEDFELTAQSDLSGADRFFIVFKSNSVLSSGDTLGVEALNVYKANNESFVTIAGITPDLGKLDVRLYSMLGVAVKQTVLNTTTATQRVSTAGLASGLYIVQIKSGNQTTVKKVIVK